jgi:hypothetical protein
MSALPLLYIIIIDPIVVVAVNCLNIDSAVAKLGSIDG